MTDLPFDGDAKSREEAGVFFGELLCNHERGYRKVEDLHDLNILIQEVPEREREVIIQRFFEGRTLEDIGIEMGVSRERVRQLERIGIQAMRAKAIQSNEKDAK
jgi:RNA polymerase sigma-B factor